MHIFIWMDLMGFLINEISDLAPAGCIITFVVLDFVADSMAKLNHASTFVSN